MGSPVLSSRQNHSALTGMQQFPGPGTLLHSCPTAGAAQGGGWHGAAAVVLVADAAEALWTTISLTPVCSHLTIFTFLYLLQSATAVPADHLACSLIGGAPDWTGEPLVHGCWSFSVCTQSGLVSGTAAGHLCHHQRLSWRQQEVLDSSLDLVRNILSSNLVFAALYSYGTSSVPRDTDQYL